LDNSHLLKALNLIHSSSGKKAGPDNKGVELNQEMAQQLEMNGEGAGLSKGNQEDEERVELNKEGVELSKDTLQELEDFRAKLDSAFTHSGLNWEGVVEHIWCFGPRQTGPNLLINAVHGYNRSALWPALKSSSDQPLREYDNSIVSGFQLATLAGPLCEEPMHGVCFLLKGWQDHRDQSNLSDQTHNPDTPDHPVPQDESASTNRSLTRSAYGPFSGQLISAMKEGCRQSFLAQPARLMMAMYSSNILATADVLGKVYSVLGRRNGKVLSEEMKEGSAMFTIQALVPVAESFGFAEEIRKRTSGLANPQLIFSHWEVNSWGGFLATIALSTDFITAGGSKRPFLGAFH
jgi:ribosome assembly protein 1